MPMDPDIQGQRLQLQKPAAMSDVRVKAFFEFLINSYDGTLPEEQCFRFKHEARHLNLPAPVPPSDPNIHHAAAAAAKTILTKQKRGLQAPKHGTRPKVKKADDVNDEYQDLPGLMQELDESYQDDAQELTKGAKNQRTAPKKGRSTHFISPSPPLEEPFADKPTPAPTTQKASPLVALPLSSNKHLPRSNPSSSQGKPAPQCDMIDLSHHQFRPGYGDMSGEWTSLWITYQGEPSEKPQFSVDKACAIFTQIEVSVSQFINATVASEEAVLNLNLGLLQAMRVAVFMKPSGFVRDGNKTGENAKTNLSTRGSLFSLRRIRQQMPREFNTSLELVLAARSWWTPGGSGAPRPVEMPNREVFATENLFDYVRKINWSDYSLLERSQVMLLLFAAAIQTEKGHASERQAPMTAQSTTEMVSEGLRTLTTSVKQSTEIGRREDSITIPTDKGVPAMRSGVDLTQLRESSHFSMSKAKR
ncbi:hypothetical protein FS837_002102 [Tulasnella sp. UAMH 9824]|nr:hypothetical protein FS837_002102 [Tulasnella sp. UAMH 9824]